MLFISMKNQIALQLMVNLLVDIGIQLWKVMVNGVTLKDFTEEILGILM